MHIFISAGEPSGDLHGSNLIRALREHRPHIRFTGFGGERMAEAGCELLYPLTHLAVMWFIAVYRNLVRFIRLLILADRHFRDDKPDAVVVIDYPGFHWWLAWRAKKRGIPVYYFVPPQLWAWAPWRAGKMRRCTDHVLCSLPFEEAWFRSRGLSAHMMGHPYFDELHRQRIDAAFVAEQRHKGPVIAILPGSRRLEVIRNLPMMLEAARRIHARHPETRFLVASFNEEQRQLAESMRDRSDPLPITFHVGRTPDIIASATACLSVSGSVGLELLFRAVPTVVVYRLKRRFDVFVGNLFRICPYISLVNLLAGQELFPEFLTGRDIPEALAEKILHWLDHPTDREQTVRALEAINAEVSTPGACDRAARFILSHHVEAFEEQRQAA